MSTSAPAAKARLATVWLGGCSGCHMSFLDLDERLLDLAPFIELCYSPIADAKEFPEVDVTLVEGAVAADEHRAMIQRIRSRSKIVVAFGDCAVTGNITALRNGLEVGAVIERSYREKSDIVNGVPGLAAGGPLPILQKRVEPLHEVVRIDHFLGGCPPSADSIHALLRHLLLGGPKPAAARFG